VARHIWVAGRGGATPLPGHEPSKRQNGHGARAPCG
jgi:hypothetical protein